MKPTGPTGDYKNENYTHIRVVCTHTHTQARPTILGDVRSRAYMLLGLRYTNKRKFSPSNEIQNVL